MNDRSRPTLFLMETLIVITIFAVCASVCVKIFIGSYLMAKDTRDLKHALVVAKNGAECFKAYGDLEKTAAFLGGHGYILDGSPTVVVYYNSEWLVCGEAEADYALRLKSRAADKGTVLPLLCELFVEKITGEEIIGFAVAARRKIK